MRRDASEPVIPRSEPEVIFRRPWLAIVWAVVFVVAFGIAAGLITKLVMRQMGRNAPAAVTCFHQLEVRDAA